MAVPRVIKVLFDWKVAYIERKIRGIDAKIGENNREIRRLRRLADTGMMIEALEERNDVLKNVDKKKVQDELNAFKKGNNGHKYGMATQNLTVVLESLDDLADALPKQAGGDALKTAKKVLEDLLKKAAEALPPGDF